MKGRRFCFFVVALALAAIAAGERNALAGRDEAGDMARVQSSSCPSSKIQRQTLFAVSFPPDTPISAVVERWSRRTCRKFLLPRKLGERKITIHSYGVVLFEEAEALFLATLRSVSLGLQRAGRFQRVVEVERQDEPRRDVLARFSIQQLQLTSVVSSPVDPVALIDDPKGLGQIVRLGDRVGNRARRVVEIGPDQVVFEAPGNTGKETLQAVVRPGWEIGEGWAGTPGP
jgi:hypothetical protein